MRKNLFTTTALAFLISTHAASADGNFTITSPNIKNGGVLSKEHEFSGFGCGLATLGPLDSCNADNSKADANGFDCQGRNVMPTISWNNAPEKTKSFAFTVFDPDMPTGAGWWNFVVYNIPRSTTKISGKVPEGAMASTNDSGTKYYMGACPPKGKKHRYIFTVYALDVSSLDIPPTATASMTAYAIIQHNIGTASLVATYQR